MPSSDVPTGRADDGGDRCALSELTLNSDAAVGPRLGLERDELFAGSLAARLSKCRGSSCRDSEVTFLSRIAAAAGFSLSSVVGAT
jgi:hypothetical protein